MLRKPDYQTLRQEKKEEVEREDASRDAFLVYDVQENKVIVEKFKEKELQAEKDSTETNPAIKDSLQPRNQELQADYALVYQPGAGITDSIFRIKSFKLAEEKARPFFIRTKEEKEGDQGVYEYDLSLGREKLIDSGIFAYEKLAVDKQGQQIAYLSTRDTTEEDSLNFELFHFKDHQLRRITDRLGKNLRPGWELSNAQEPFFSETGKRLFFFSRPERQFNVDTTILEDEMPEVDVWNYKDRLIQPKQKAELKDLED